MNRYFGTIILHVVVSRKSAGLACRGCGYKAGGANCGKIGLEVVDVQYRKGQLVLAGVYRQGG